MAMCVPGAVCTLHYILTFNEKAFITYSKKIIKMQTNFRKLLYKSDQMSIIIGVR